MKRLGVQIAAGTATVLLGALAAAYAQKDRPAESDTSWNAQADQANAGPPPPIEDIASASPVEDSVAGHATYDDGAPGAGPLEGEPARPFSPPDDAVRLVQHTETDDDESAFSAAPPSLTFAAPPESTGESRSQPADGAFGKPGSAEPTEPRSDSATPDSESTSGGFSGGWSLPVQDESDQAAAEIATAAADPASGPSFSMQMPGPADSPAAAEASASSVKDVSSAKTDESPAPEESPTGKPSAGDFSSLPQLAFGEPPTTEMAGAAVESGEVHPANMLRGGDTTTGPAAAPALAESDRGEEGSDRQAKTNGSLPGAAAEMGLEIPSSDAASDGKPTLSTPTLTAGVSANSGPQNPQPEADYTRETPEYPDERIASRGQNAGSSASDHLAAPRLPESAAAEATQLPAESTPALSYASRPQPSTPTASPSRLSSREASPIVLAAPGDRRLEGAQSPSVVIQKRAPTEVKVGKPAVFVIEIQNVGSAEAFNVRVHDRVPGGMRLVDASPAPVRQGDQLFWQLGALPAGDQRTVTMQLVPEQEGELGSVARVSFEAAASVRTVSTRPELKIVQRAPEFVMIGQQLEIELEVSNPGTGEASGVVLQEDVPQGLDHPKGRQLDNFLGSLRPGEVRREILRLRAVEPGVVQNTVRLIGEGGLETENTVEVEVVAPQLQVGLNGPSRRYLERQATYQVDIANVGSAEATNVEIAAFLDRGFTFVSTGQHGQYDSARHAVFWSLERLPKGQSGSVPLTLLPVEEGDQAIRLEATADLNASAQHEQSVAVDSLAELTFQIADAADPIELGSETTYEIKIRNSGSRDDGNVRVELQLPGGLELVSSDTDATTDASGSVQFAPRPQLATGGELVYRVKVRGVEPGRHVAQVTVVSDQSNVPVTKEESTMVYADR